MASPASAQQWDIILLGGALPIPGEPMPLSSLPEAMDGEQGGEALMMEPLEVPPMGPTPLE